MLYVLGDSSFPSPVVPCSGRQPRPNPLSRASNASGASSPPFCSHADHLRTLPSANSSPHHQAFLCSLCIVLPSYHFSYSTRPRCEGSRRRAFFDGINRQGCQRLLLLLGAPCSTLEDPGLRSEIDPRCPPSQTAIDPSTPFPLRLFCVFTIRTFMLYRATSKRSISISQAGALALPSPGLRMYQIPG